MTYRRTVFAATLIAATLALGGGGAHAATGDLDYRDCLSGELNLAACTPISGATADGADSGLGGVGFVEVGVGGASLYSTAGTDDAVAHFQRSPAGALTYEGCIGSDSNSPCTPIPGAVAGGVGTPLHGAEDVRASPDGADLYALGSDAVSRFAIGPGGALSYAGCIGGNTDIAGCSYVPAAAPAGTDSGLDGLEGLVFSPDGRLLYVVSGSDGAITWFERGAAGALGFRGCISADSGAVGCEQLPFAAANAIETGFDSLRGIAISPDGRSLYVVSDSDEAIAAFSIAADGSPDFEGCITGQTTIAPCTPIAGATPTGADTGLRSLVDVTVSPDGNSVYAISDGDSAIAHFGRDPDSGAISFRSCHSGKTDVACTPVPGAATSAKDTGFDFPTVARVGPDGRSVHVTATGDDALASFDRDPLSGELEFAGCISGRTTVAPCEQVATATLTGADSGLDSIRELAISADGSTLYSPARKDAAVVRFGREPDAAGPSLRLTGSRKQRGGRVKVKLECRDEYCPTALLRGKIKIRRSGGGASAAAEQARSRRFSLRRVKLSDLQPGERVTAKLKLSKRSRRALRKGGKGKVKVTATAEDLLENGSKKRKRVKLKRPPR